MILITMEKIYNTLKYEMPDIEVDEKLRKKEERSINRMLEIRKEWGVKKNRRSAVDK